MSDDEFVMAHDDDDDDGTTPCEDYSVSYNIIIYTYTYGRRSHVLRRYLYSRTRAWATVSDLVTFAIMNNNKFKKYIVGHTENNIILCIICIIRNACIICIRILKCYVKFPVHCVPDDEPKKIPMQQYAVDEVQKQSYVYYYLYVD